MSRAPRLEGLDPGTLAQFYPGVESYRVSELRRGAAASVYKLTNRDGALVCKVLPGATPEARIRFITAVQRTLAAEALAPSILVTADGRDYAALDAGWCLLSPYVDGTVLDRNRASIAHLESVGDLLARAHLALEHEESLAGGFLMESPLDPGTRLAELGAAAHDRPDPARVTSAIALKTELLAQLFPMGAVAPPEARGIVHGDVHLGNILFDGPHARMLLDFERACYFPRLYELLRAMFLCGFKGLEGDLERMEAVARGYLRNRPIASSDLAAAVDFYFFVQLADTYGLDGGPFDSLFVDYRLGIIGWLSTHRDALKGHLSGLREPFA